ncbi:MAG: hypothetical protein JWQ62_2334 [Lacunisphaera sp.]|jgi:hypothetical protein|nr:hypothetical protein [Lacunisphaera sp.]
MKKFFRRAALVLLVLLGAMQFWHPARNVAASPGPNDINVRHPVPPRVQALLQRACYDCHSNNTHYPWYASVQPVSWWLTSHVNDGKRHLDFSEYGAYPPKRAASKAGAIADEVDQHSMPLTSYTWMHPEARLTPEEIKLIVDWAEGLQDELTPP